LLNRLGKDIHTSFLLKYRVLTLDRDEAGELIAPRSRGLVVPKSALIDLIQLDVLSVKEIRVGAAPASVLDELQLFGLETVFFCDSLRQTGRLPTDLARIIRNNLHSLRRIEKISWRVLPLSAVTELEYLSLKEDDNVPIGMMLELPKTRTLKYSSKNGAFRPKFFSQVDSTAIIFDAGDISVDDFDSAATNPYVNNLAAFYGVPTKVEYDEEQSKAYDNDDYFHEDAFCAIREVRVSEDRNLTMRLALWRHPLPQYFSNYSD
ncbi:hypothetical protein AAVH_20110, partial [Aphelenchoides avenae]